MRTNSTVTLEPGDHLAGQVITTVGDPAAVVKLTHGATLIVRDPAQIRELSRLLDGLAVELSQALDIEAARAVNAHAGLPIVCQAGTVHLDWSSANACTAGHTITAAAGAA